MYSQKHTERFVRDPMNPTGGGDNKDNKSLSIHTTTS